jgi:FtsP/CotA-like multicopper oxidase with cupredoxin domain
MAVPPGGTFDYEFTLKDAGYYWYHPHMHGDMQVEAGLYAPIIVLEPGETYDPETDRVLMFSDGGPTTNVINGPFPSMWLNGKAQPDPMTLRAGVKYRFRVIGITGDAPIELKFLNGTTPIEWRAIARDGMTLPPAQATTRAAAMLFDPGQIFDYEYTPSAAGNLAIEFNIPDFIFPPGKAPKHTRVPVRVQ